MKKYCLDLKVVSLDKISKKYVLVKLTSGDGTPLPDMRPGQFVEVQTGGPMLRRPISIHFVDKANNQLWLLVAVVGEGTKKIAQLKFGDTLNCVLPLGNGFTIPASGSKLLLAGGGVGVAPLLNMGKECKDMGIDVTFLLGARTAADLLELDEFKKYGNLALTTEDGSQPKGYEDVTEKGFVTMHSVWNTTAFDQISVCGPKPMMVAVAKMSREKNTYCEVSLENMMACGVGACLCCVENTKDGNVCVCKEGPVFDIEKLNW